MCGQEIARAISAYVFFDNSWVQVAAVLVYMYAQKIQDFTASIYLSLLLHLVPICTRRSVKICPRAQEVSQLPLSIRVVTKLMFIRAQLQQLEMTQHLLLFFFLVVA